MKENPNTNDFFADDANKGASYYFIMWGIIVILYSLLTYLSITYNWQIIKWTYCLFAIGGLLSVIHGKKNTSEPTGNSWTKIVYSKVWLAIGICLALTWIGAPLIGISKIVPISLMLYSIASYITGSITRFIPSVIGAIVCIICAVISLYFDYAYQHLLASVAVLCVHVIPGIIMRRQG